MKKLKVLFLMLLFFVGINVVMATEEGLSDNNYLSQLEVNVGKIDFNKNTSKYEFVVLYDVSNIEVKAETEDSTARYEILGNENLVVGENIITVRVIAEDESVREYKIEVTRKDENETISSNSKLLYLGTGGYNLNFATDVYEYELNIEDETYLILNYRVADVNSKVNVKGNYNLQDGSVINVVVTAEDGSFSEYKINISKGNSSLIMYITIVGGVILLLLLILMIVLSARKKKKSSGLKDNNTSVVDNVNNNQGIQSVPTSNVQTAQTYQTVGVVPNPQVNSTLNNNSIGNVQGVPANNVVTNQPIPPVVSTQTVGVVQPVQDGNTVNNQNAVISQNSQMNDTLNNNSMESVLGTDVVQSVPTSNVVNSQPIPPVVPTQTVGIVQPFQDGSAVNNQNINNNQ